MEQLILHLLGDYVLQSDWMANNKTKSSLAALSHTLVYSLPFLMLTKSAPSPAFAGVVILVTHFLIDRFRLARFVVFAKNFLSPGEYPVWSNCSATGYPSERPAWLAVWLLIAADNTLHLAINYVALRWL
jgi:hypothetical protein